MSVLNIESLKALAENQNLLGSDYTEKNFQPSSYDLRIGTIYKNGKIISLSHPQPNIYYVKVKPSEIITLLTFEEVDIPHNCCGSVFALNSHSSSGLLILNPGHIDPGYKGPISICAINLSKNPIKLKLKDSIFTLVLENLDNIVPEADRYKNKVYEDRKELEELQYKDRFENLSNSFFDLVLKYDKANKLLVDRIYENFIAYGKKFISFLLIIVALLGGIYLIFPNSIIFNVNSKSENSNRSGSVLINNYNDSINMYKDSISILKHELESIEINKATTTPNRSNTNNN